MSIKIPEEYKITFKIIGVFAFIVAGFIYGHSQYIAGRQIQCYEQGGFLVFENEEPYCKDRDELYYEGYEVIDHRTIRSKPRQWPSYEEMQKVFEKINATSWN